MDSKERNRLIRDTCAKEFAKLFEKLLLEEETNNSQQTTAANSDHGNIINYGNIIVPENIYGVKSSSGLQRMNSFEHPSTYGFMSPYDINRASYSDRIYRPMIPTKINIESYKTWLILEEEMHRLLPSVPVTHESKILVLQENNLLRRDSFFAAISNANESNVVSFIRNLKGTGLGSTMTRIIATRFYDVMTHPTAKRVIRACLNHLENKANMVLYELAIKYFRELAVHEQGCLSLNECINTIAGTPRKMLLFSIASESSYFSHDPYGNHVVQHVLALRHDNVNREILSRLEGQFVSLAQKKGGSYVVEKCLETSVLGTRTVVGDILKCPNNPFVLARDIFGNYVIQKALQITKELGVIEYRYLVDALASRSEELTRSKGGRLIMNIIQDDILNQLGR